MQVTDVCAVIAIGLSSQFGLRGRLPWDGNRGREYVADVERFFYSTPWLEHEAPRFDICLYNAGMDPFRLFNRRHRRCHAKSSSRPGDDRVSWCRMRSVPIVFVLAGGYLGPELERAGLVALHRLTLEAACS